MNLPEFNMPKPFTSGDDFVESIGEYANTLRSRLKADEDFVGEYLHGSEVITIANIGVAGRDTVRLLGYDKQEQPCHIFAHVASLTVVFRVVKKVANTQQRQYGFVADSSKQ